MLSLFVIALFVTVLAGLVAVDSRAHHLDGRWWEDRSMDGRLAGQLHLRHDAQAALRTLDENELAARRPGLTGRAERKARHMLDVLKREIPETRDAIAAAEAAAEVAAASPSTSGGAAYAGGGLPAYVVECESHGDPNAVNPDSGAFGWAQTMPQHWTKDGWGYGEPGVCYGLDRSSSADYAECVRRILGSSGLGAWDCA